MLLRGFLIIMVLLSSIVISTQLVIDGAPHSVAGLRIGGDSTLALAPLSLGNPAAAAMLRTNPPSLGSESLPDLTPYFQTVEIGRGSTLGEVLMDAGIEREETHAAIVALKEHYDPRRIRAGQAVTVTFQPTPEGQGPGQFLGFVMAPDAEHRVTVSRDGDGGFAATMENIPLARSLARASGAIDTSLYESGVAAGLPPPVLDALIRALSWDVDFQRDIQPDDEFDVMYEQFLNEEGHAVRYGRVLFGSLTLSGVVHAVYLHTQADGEEGYFNAHGQSARKALLRTPIDGAKLTSRFGNRKHPILGFNRMHRGVDFAAPPGTPIYAAGSGTIDFLGTKGAYGRYVRIRHTPEYSTAYAHMSRFAKDLDSGDHVKQGEVIGFVGTTGLSSGPHLHYEILRDGHQVNPLQVKMPSGFKLQGKELALFMKTKADIDRRLAGLAPPTTVAGNQK